jgi:hypothetical protein
MLVEGPVTGAACDHQVYLCDMATLGARDAPAPSWIAPPTKSRRGPTGTPSAPAQTCTRGCTRRPSVGGPLSVTRENPMEPDPYAREERLTIIAVELPDVVVTGTHGAHHRARCVLFEESKRAAPLQPGDVVIVRSTNSGLAVVERVTAGRPDGCWYVLLEFRPISPPNRVRTSFTSVGNEADRVGPL